MTRWESIGIITSVESNLLFISGFSDKASGYLVSIPDEKLTPGFLSKIQSAIQSSRPISYCMRAQQEPETLSLAEMQSLQDIKKKAVPLESSSLDNCNRKVDKSYLWDWNLVC